MSSLIPHDYRYKISSPTPVDKEPKSIVGLGVFYTPNLKGPPKDFSRKNCLNLIYYNLYFLSM